jgi:hypothetical protein
MVIEELRTLAEKALEHAVRAYGFSPSSYNYETVNVIRKLALAITRMEAETASKENECVS